MQHDFQDIGEYSMLTSMLLSWYYNSKWKTARSSGYPGPFSSCFRGLVTRARDPLWPMLQGPTAASVRDVLGMAVVDIVLGYYTKEPLEALSTPGYLLESSCCTVPKLWIVCWPKLAAKPSTEFFAVWISP